MGTIYVILIYEYIDIVWHACVYIDTYIYIYTYIVCMCACVIVEFKSNYCLKLIFMFKLISI